MATVPRSASSTAGQASARSSTAVRGLSLPSSRVAIEQPLAGTSVGAVIADAFLSFRSAVGEDYGFGLMVYDGIVWSSLMAGIAPTPWWIMLAGAGGITLLAAAFYLLGVGLREALDPRSGGILG